MIKTRFVTFTVTAVKYVFQGMIIFSFIFLYGFIFLVCSIYLFFVLVCTLMCLQLLD